MLCGLLKGLNPRIIITESVIALPIIISFLISFFLLSPCLAFTRLEYIHECICCSGKIYLSGHEKLALVFYIDNMGLHAGQLASIRFFFKCFLCYQTFESVSLNLSWVHLRGRFWCQFPGNSSFTSNSKSNFQKKTAILPIQKKRVQKGNQKAEVNIYDPFFIASTTMPQLPLLFEFHAYPTLRLVCFAVTSVYSEETYRAVPTSWVAIRFCQFTSATQFAWTPREPIMRSLAFVVVIKAAPDAPRRPI